MCARVNPKLANREGFAISNGIANMYLLSIFAKKIIDYII